MPGKDSDGDDGIVKQAMKLLRALRWELALMALTLIWPLLVFGGANLLTEVVNRAAAVPAAQT